MGHLRMSALRPFPEMPTLFRFPKNRVWEAFRNNAVPEAIIAGLRPAWSDSFRLLCLLFSPRLSMLKTGKGKLRVR